MMQKLSASLQILLFATIGASLLTGCGPGGTAVERGNRDQVLHASLGAEPEGLDPHLMTSVAAADVLRALQEGLVGGDPSDLSPVPGIAERWDVSEDNRTYTFHLRENARWSNGDPITADDFLFSFQRILSPALGAQYAEMLFVTENAEAYYRGEIDDFSEVGFEVIDDRTLRIRLENPTPYFLSLLTNPAWTPVHPATILEHGDIDERGTRWTRAGNFVGSGPFTLTSWEISRRIVVSRNPHYWDADSVRLNEIHFHPMESSETQERAFRAGQIHYTRSIQPSKIDHYEETEPDLIRSEPYLGSYFFRINTRNEPFNDARVRKAISLAIDQESLVRNVMHGHTDAAGCLTPPDPSGYIPRAHVGFDPERARALLAEAGYPDGEGFPAFDFLFNTQETHRKIAEAVQQMLRKHLNIEMTLYNQEWQAYLASVLSGDYEIARGGWIGDYLDPSTFLDMFVTDGGHNNTGWSNASYDSVIDEARRATDPEARLELFQQAEAILLDEMPIIPLYHYRNNYLIRPSVKGWHSNLLDRQSYKQLYLEPKAELETETSN